MKVTTKLIVLYIVVSLIACMSYDLLKIYSTYNLIVSLSLISVAILLNIKKILSKRFKDILFGVIILLFSIIAIFISSGGMGSVLVLLTLVFGIPIYSELKFTKFDKKIIFGALLISFTVTFINSIFTVGNFQYSDEVFNPNTVGYIMTCLTVLIIIIYEHFSKSTRKIKFFSLIIGIIGLLGTIFSESRASLVALLIFLLLYFFFPKKNLKSSKILNIIFLIIIIVGVTFPLVYVKMYEYGVNFTIPFIEKDFYTGRQVLWGETLFLLDKTPNSMIFGLGSNYVLNSVTNLNIHNLFLGIIFNFGIPIFVLLLFFFFIKFKKIDSQIAKFAVIAIFINGFFETTFLTDDFLLFSIMIFTIGYWLKDKNEVAS